MREMGEITRFIGFSITTRTGEERQVIAREEAAPVVLEQYSGRISSAITSWTENQHGRRMFDSNLTPAPVKK